MQAKGMVHLQIAELTNCRIYGLGNFRIDEFMDRNPKIPKFDNPEIR
jgi:hypothetical protein